VRRPRPRGKIGIERVRAFGSDTSPTWCDLVASWLKEAARYTRAARQKVLASIRCALAVAADQVSAEIARLLDGETKGGRKGAVGLFQPARPLQPRYRLLYAGRSVSPPPGRRDLTIKISNSSGSTSRRLGPANSSMTGAGR
jgi:hypothetical protein